MVKKTMSPATIVNDNVNPAFDQHLVPTEKQRESYKHDSVINDSRAAGGEHDTTQQEKTTGIK